MENESAREIPRSLEEWDVLIQEGIEKVGPVFKVHQSNIEPGIIEALKDKYHIDDKQDDEYIQFMKKG